MTLLPNPPLAMVLHNHGSGLGSPIRKQQDDRPDRAVLQARPVEIGRELVFYYWLTMRMKSRSTARFGMEGVDEYRRTVPESAPPQGDVLAKQEEVLEKMSCAG